MPTLAILGGDPVLKETLSAYNSIGGEEIAAATKVLNSGVLSKFVGAPCDDFFGGPAVRQLETDWSRTFGCKYSISVNSATSGLFAALGAIGVGPGDEVIVPPYTMSATAMAPLIYGAVPVFCDIEDTTFCLDAQKVRSLVTPKTKAILVVNLFGHAAALHELRSMADELGIKLIEDNAQGPLATESGRFAGTIGHIGVFSLNYHKHFHCGEGGICVTDDADLAQRLQMIRNHGENLTEEFACKDITNLIGYNYRLTEISAAIAVEQLKKAEYHVSKRQLLAEQLTQSTIDLEALSPPVVRPNCRHVYYVWSAKFDKEASGVSRELFSAALTAEGFPNSVGYVKPLYMLPVFQQRVAIGAHGFPFNLSNRTYDAGLCPVTERMHEEELLEFHICSFDVSQNQADGLCEAIRKVHSNLPALKRSHFAEQPEYAVAPHRR